MPEPTALQTTVELPPLARLAKITPSSIDSAQRTVDVTFSTGAAVKRFDWRTGEYFLEKLSLDPAHVRLERLKAGAPVLDSHSGWRLGSILGVVEDASVDGKRGLASLRFSKRTEVDGVWKDVEDKVVKNVSVGYEVHAYRDVPAKENKLQTRIAIDWEPYEISFVPMPADIDAQTRDGKQQVRTHTAVIVSPDAPSLVADDAPSSDTPLTTRQERSPMNPNQTTSETIVEPDPLDPGAPLQPQRSAPNTTTEPTQADLARAAEQRRISGIIQACLTGRMTQKFQQDMITGNVSLEEAQTRVLAEIANRDGDAQPQRPAGRGTGVETVGDDPLVHVRAGISNALLHRIAPQHFKLEEVGHKYRGLSLMAVAELMLRARGIRTTSMNKMEIAGAALGLRSGPGYHTTSDYTDLLADVANKTLRRAYEEAPQTFAPITRRTTAPDFKNINRVQLGDAPDLLRVDEHGEFTRGTIGEGKETYRLLTYGRVFAISRQAIVNDDTDAFSRVPMAFGRKARILESDLAWEQITSNPTMGDGNALFSTAHANVAAAADLATISVTSLGVGRAAMRNQTSLDGDLMNLTARYLLVPPSLETLADQHVTLITPQQATNVNPFMGRLSVIAEPRLEAVSSSAWYLATSADAIDIIELAYLEGNEGPMVETRIGFDVDGLEIKCRLDVAAKVIDWRGLYLNEGVGAS